MGRPRKEEPAADEVAVVDEMPMPKGEKLKACPRCGEDKARAFADSHGLWRCACPGCGFWDSVVSYTEDEAKKSWQKAGGPSQEGHNGD